MPAAVVTHLASLVGVSAAEAAVAYDWRRRTIKYHPAQIRTAPGFRETSARVADNDGLAAVRTVEAGYRSCPLGQAVDLA